MKEAVKCELCKATATLHCAADASHLCFACDRRVHSVNFLAARHVRSFISDPSKSLTGPGASDEPDASTSSSESSVSAVDCSSTLERRVLESWGKRMGLRSWRRCADVAIRVLISGRVRGFARRAEMAAAMWVGVKTCGSGDGGDACEMMKRLASCSGVSAKVILGIFRKRYLDRAVKKRKSEINTKYVMEEGWDNIMAPSIQIHI